jgi:hypothetical protein
MEPRFPLRLGNGIPHSHLFVRPSGLRTVRESNRESVSNFQRVVPVVQEVRVELQKFQLTSHVEPVSLKDSAKLWVVAWQL